MNDALPAIEAETLILVTRTVTDLDDFVARPENYLVSIDHEPNRAAQVWQERLKRGPYGSDGLVRLAYCGRDVFTADQWDDVDGIWQELVGLCRSFREAGEATALFPGQPLPMSFTRKGNVGVFTVGSNRVIVDPADFVRGVLTSAEHYFAWVEDEVGEDRSNARAAVQAARRLA